MAVDAVMSMMGTGLGDAVVEVVYRVECSHMPATLVLTGM